MEETSSALAFDTEFLVEVTKYRLYIRSGSTCRERKEGITLEVPEKRKGAILCSYKEIWKEELEKRLHTDERVTLLAIGRIRYKLLAYLRKRKDIEIVKVETRYMKNRDKGIGLKVTVRKM